MPFFRIIWFILLILLSSQTVRASERFPPPNFESGHELPVISQTPPRAGIYEYVDVIVLLAVLSLTSYVALKRRSRRGIFVIGVFSLAYFGFWREGCVCAIGSIQNITLAMFDANYTVPLAVIAYFVLPILFTLFFGRTFCAGACPLGAIQDVVSVRPARVPSWLESSLGLFAALFTRSHRLFSIYFKICVSQLQRAKQIYQC